MTYGLDHIYYLKIEVCLIHEMETWTGIIVENSYLLFYLFVQFVNVLELQLLLFELLE